MPSDGEVFLIQTSNRISGIEALLDHFDLNDFSGKKVAVKANFNSADPFPATTHLDTLKTIIKSLQEADTTEIIMAERSGMGDTRTVLEKMGVFSLSKELGFKLVVLDEVAEEDWVKIDREGTHWLRGFYIAKPFLDADKVVQTCCLKTHRFGGHFTLSLKNSVGMVAKRIPGSIYNYMWELHGSPFQRQLIAEINKHYPADLIVMDGAKIFVDGGPEQGKEIEAGLLLASRDRIAIDAVGVAVLRHYGSTHDVMKDRIFELDQLKRASELKIGVQSASEIKLTPLTHESQEITQKLSTILEQEG